MKFSASILLISVALATVASAAPLAHINVNANANVPVSKMSKRHCGDCTHKDAAALDVIVRASALHYADIAHVHLDKLMDEINTAKVTSNNQELAKEKALLSITVQAKIDEAKEACNSEALEPMIMATVTADPNLDIPWSKKDEVEKKMAELDIKITNLVLDRIQANINAELLSKACAEKMTMTQISPAPIAAVESEAEAPAPTIETPAPAPESPAPAPESPAPAPETPAPAPETPAPVPETPAPVPETPAPVPETPAPVPEVAPVPVPATVPVANGDASFQEEAVPEPNNETANGGLRVGIDVVAADVDPKYVCQSGCKDSNDAKQVLNLRVTLENELSPRLEHFYTKEVPTACTEKRVSLLHRVLSIIGGGGKGGLEINVDANVNV
ncbi:hypothetical protein BG004_007993 [Podila humilis]|nr:hypothetical protein BG004_007993 [Podila humilis]